MSEDDKVLRDFFSEMKNSDSDIEMPEFHSMIKKKRRLNLITVAASLILIALSVWYFLTPTQEPASIEIVVTEESSDGSLSLMTQDNSIEEWKSPTQSLIDDF